MIKGIVFDFDGVLTRRYISAYRMYQWIIGTLTLAKPKNLQKRLNSRFFSVNFLKIFVVWMLYAVVQYDIMF